jgi:hypothetical protein
VLLTGAYVVAPFAAVGLGHALSSSGSADVVAGVGVGLMAMLPATVHIAYGKTGYGLLSYLELAALTGLGVVVGGTVGGLITFAACDPEQDSDNCDFAVFPGAPIGAFIGGVLLYSGFAVYDVMANGSVMVGREQDQDQARLQLWLGPAPAALAEAPERDALWSGLQLGLAGQW